MTWVEKKAIKKKDLLLTVKAQGEKDGTWNYRMGHSCFYLSEYEEALVYLERAKELGCGDWADELLPQCKALINEPKLKPVNTDKDMVSQFIEYSDCPCTLFNPKKDGDSLMVAFENQDGQAVSQFHNSKANTLSRIESGKWISVE